MRLKTFRSSESLVCSNREACKPACRSVCKVAVLLSNVSQKWNVSAYLLKLKKKKREILMEVPLVILVNRIQQADFLQTFFAHAQKSSLINLNEILRWYFKPQISWKCYFFSLKDFPKFAPYFPLIQPDARSRLTPRAWVSVVDRISVGSAHIVVE